MEVELGKLAQQEVQLALVEDLVALQVLVED
jgi:hypothetical protein